MNYSEWQRARAASRLERARGAQPAAWNRLFSLVVFRSGEDSLGEALKTADSIEAQLYRNIEIILAGFPSRSLAEHTAASGLRGLFEVQSRDLVDFLHDPDSDSQWRGSHIFFARAGTTFDPDAFELLNRALDPDSAGASSQIVICDHDRRSASGELEAPCFLPGWDPDLIQSLDYVGAACGISRDILSTCRTGPRPASLHDWLCGVTLAQPGLRVAHVAETLVHLPDNTIPCRPLPQVSDLRDASSPQEWPDVAVIIPTRNQPDLLARCLRSLESQTGIHTELILVDNESDDPTVFDLYSDVCSRQSARLLSVGRPFNFSRMVNLGVKEATAKLIVLLNNDIEFDNPLALAQMVAHASRAEVGVVGSRLLYPDGTVQHSGMYLRPGKNKNYPIIAPHVSRGASRDAEGYLYQLQTIRNYQSVTGALIATRRDVFVELGGFDEERLPVEFNDVDFCLRVRKAGLRVICLPLDGIFHAESSTRAGMETRAAERMRLDAMAVMAKRWSAAFLHDPFRNPWLDTSEIPEAPFPWEVSEDNGARQDSLRFIRRHPLKALRTGLRQMSSAFLRRSNLSKSADAIPSERENHIRTPEGAVPTGTAPAVRLQSGLCISGHMLSEIGLGQAARNLAYACDDRRLPVSFHNMSLLQRDNEPEFSSKCNPVVDRRVNVIVLGLPGIQHLQHDSDAGQFNVLYPFWELGRIPPELLSAASRFDAIWAPSRFVANAFSQGIDRPVHLVPQPVRFPVCPPRNQRREQSTLRVFTFLDFDSYGARKNPQATVSAFVAAFGSGRRDAELVVKTRGERDAGLRQDLARAAAVDPRIRIIDRTLDRAAVDRLMADCDVFISLHRSEGFGFGAAEALAAGKIVVATDYGGTRDFISAETGFPLPYDLESVRPGDYIFGEGQVWATVRQEAAVAALQAIYDAPSEGFARAARGFNRLRATNSISVVGAEIEKRLGELDTM